MRLKHIFFKEILIVDVQPSRRAPTKQQTVVRGIIVVFQKPDLVLVSCCRQFEMTSVVNREYT